MKKILVLTLVLISSFLVAHAQDTLYTKSGDILLTKILEITPDYVKYKKQEFLDGPTYTTEKSALFMIRYQNGTKDVFLKEEKNLNDDYANKKIVVKKDNKLRIEETLDNPIDVEGNRYSIGYFNLNFKKIDQLLLSKNNTKVSLMIKTAQETKRASKLLSFAPIPLGVGAYVTLIAGSIAGTTNYNQSIPDNYLSFAAALGAAAFGTGVAAIILNAKSKRQRREAVYLYNKVFYGY
jgi:hypothetical protein